MTIKIDINQSVYDLCMQHPEIKNIMSELGFENITKPRMLETVGKIMTIPKGCHLKRIKLDDVIQKLNQNGYSIE